VRLENVLFFLKKVIPKPAFVLFQPAYHFVLAFLSAFFYGFPSKKLKVIGITGTNGKSTVVFLTEKVLENAGKKVGCVSSFKFKIGKREWQNRLKMTLPGRFKLQKMLREMVNEKCEYAVIEVTSEGIKQYRTRFIDFDIAVFTNLTPEHIDSHRGFENYKKAKGELFRSSKRLIINLDDKHRDYFLSFPAEEKYGYGINISRNKLRSDMKDLIIAKDIKVTKNGVSFKVKDTYFNLKLLGEFNIYNCLAAISVGLSEGIPLRIIKKALEKVKSIPGRMEIVLETPKTIVDYAHTPDALKKVYKISSKFKSKNSKLICVLGSAGGGRDKWKRRELGKIAKEYCDCIILTNEDPYDENPLGIIKDIEKGLRNYLNLVGSSSNLLYKILDRRKAIRKALKLAKEKDVIIITGKGCEPWMCVKNNKKIPWDDRKIAREEYYKILNSTAKH